MPSKVGVVLTRQHGRPIYAASVSICILTGEIDGSVAKHLVCECVISSVAEMMLSPSIVTLRTLFGTVALWRSEVGTHEMKDLEAGVIQSQFQIFVTDRLATVTKSTTTPVIADSAP